MVKHSQLFIDSLIYPKKLAAYRLLTIGKIIQYVFLLITIVTLFSFGQFLSGISNQSYDLKGITEHIEAIQWLLYPFAFILQFAISTVVLFLQISIYAYIGLTILKILKRRGEYRHIWRTTALAITWSTLLSILSSFLPVSQIFVNLIGFIITLSLLIIASMTFPKAPKK